MCLGIGCGCQPSMTLILAISNESATPIRPPSWHRSGLSCGSTGPFVHPEPGEPADSASRQHNGHNGGTRAGALVRPHRLKRPAQLSVAHANLVRNTPGTAKRKQGHTLVGHDIPAPAIFRWPAAPSGVRQSRPTASCWPKWHMSWLHGLGVRWCDRIRPHVKGAGAAQIAHARVHPTEYPLRSHCRSTRCTDSSCIADIRYINMYSTGGCTAARGGPDQGFRCSTSHSAKVPAMEI